MVLAPDPPRAAVHRSCQWVLLTAWDTPQDVPPACRGPTSLQQAAERRVGVSALLGVRRNRCSLYAASWPMTFLFRPLAGIPAPCRPALWAGARTCLELPVQFVTQSARDRDS
jgi:hypothetical protein